MRLVVVLVVLSVLVGGAVVAAPVVDGAVRETAQERVAAAVASQTGATGPVEVVVGGAWFVPQALAGRYPVVHVDARGVPAEGLQLERVQADLRDVSLPLRDLLGGAPAVRVGSSTAQVLVAYPALNAYLDAQGQPVQVAPGADGGQLRVTTSAEVLGRELALSGLVDLQVRPPAGGGGSDGELLAAPTSLDTGSRVLDRLSRPVLRGLRDRLAFTVPVEGLPFGLGMTAVEVRPEGVAVSTAGGATVLG